MSIPRLPFLALVVLVSGCEVPEPYDGDGVCSEYFALGVEGVVATYRTTDPDGGEFTWTQETLARDSDGRYPLRSTLPEGASTLFYGCDAGEVVLLASESEAGSVTATEEYLQPYTVWPGGEPTVGLTWVSQVDVRATAAGVSQTQRKSGQWEILEVGTEYLDDEGNAWADSVVFNHSSDLIVDGNSIHSTEENTITSLSAPGLVWSDVVTTTPGGTAESFTEIVSVTGP